MSADPRPAVDLWLAKAASDWRAVEILSGHVDCPRDTVCFHCQQYVEKLLKGFLTLHGIEATKTHNLRRLIQLAQPVSADLGDLIDRSDALTAHAVQARYPDDWREVDAEEMDEMITLAQAFRRLLTEELGG